MASVAAPTRRRGFPKNQVQQQDLLMKQRRDPHMDEEMSSTVPSSPSRSIAFLHQTNLLTEWNGTQTVLSCVENRAHLITVLYEVQHLKRRDDASILS
jgi:hypothetical protein